MLVVQHEALRVVDGKSPVARNYCDRFQFGNRFEGDGFGGVNAHGYAILKLGKSPVPRGDEEDLRSIEHRVAYEFVSS